jgi:hypothetical protein
MNWHGYDYVPGWVWGDSVVISVVLTQQVAYSSGGKQDLANRKIRVEPFFLVIYAELWKLWLLGTALARDDNPDFLYVN